MQPLTEEQFNNLNKEALVIIASSLQDQLIAVQSQLETANAQLADQTRQLEIFAEQLRIMNQRHFGRHSEAASEIDGQLSLFDSFDYKVTVNKNNYKVELDRALENKYKTDLEYDSVYCDYDDCLILDQNIINVELVKFLYKCINEKKKILLSMYYKATEVNRQTK